MDSFMIYHACIVNVQPKNRGDICRLQSFHCKKFVYGDQIRFPYSWKSPYVLKKAKRFNFESVQVSRSGWLNIRGVATLECAQAASEQTEYQCFRVGSESSRLTEQKFPSEDSGELDDQEKLRRMRISRANKGKTPWNKGKKHSPETVRRIRERTRLAMQDPKVKRKLAKLGHAQSEETRMKIGVKLRMGWEKRKQKMMLQETCYYQWQNQIAEASRKGLLGEDELQWDSYKILEEQLEQEWLQSVEQRRKMKRTKGNRRAPKSPEQRRKISEAIAAKWADPGYRTRVTSALAKYHGIPEGSERKPRRKKTSNSETQKRSPPTNKANHFELAKPEAGGRAQQVKLKRSNAQQFKDPLSSSKLEMLKTLRAERAAADNQKSEAIVRALALIAEAEKAAKALEASAKKSPVAYASLVESRKLIAEAKQFIEPIEREGLDPHESNNSIHTTSSYLEAHSSEECNAQMEDSNQMDGENVNGVKLLGRSDKNDLDFDKSTLHDLLNGHSYQVRPLGSSSLIPPNGRVTNSATHSCDCDLSSQDDGTGQLHNPEARGCKQIKHSLRPTGGEPHSHEEQPPKSVKTTKKWVRGKLVEVTDEGEGNN